MSEKDNVKDELIVNVIKKGPKFKAGSDLASSVNRMNVEWDNEVEEKTQTLTISLHLGSDSKGD